MKVKMILPALTEATGPYWRSIKYSLFPPLGLATLAGYLDPNDDIEIQNEHVQPLDLNDTPDLVVIEVYITAARRAYEIADQYRRKGSHVCLGGLHVTSRPEEAAPHADTIFLGPGEDTWPQFLDDYRQGRPGTRYQSVIRSLDNMPAPRRDLIDRRRYLVPNTVVVTRGCPHHCDFCYKDAFFRGGKGFYTQPVDQALGEINRLPGRHVYFLDDNLFANPRFVSALMDGLEGMGRVWQAAATVQAVLREDGLVEKAARTGCRSLFIGFETLDTDGLSSVSKVQNLQVDYDLAVRKLADQGIMVNGSFVYGMDTHDESVFDRTVEWAVSAGLATATFHILTPYPGTVLYDRFARQGRILTKNWDLYDTRHAVFQPAKMTPETLEKGYWRSYQQFYRWSNIVQAAWTQPTLRQRLRHLAYAGAWKKFERVWNFVVRNRLVYHAIPLLEQVLDTIPKRTIAETSESRQPISQMNDVLPIHPESYMASCE